jgi:hypothetical protein
MRDKRINDFIDNNDSSIEVSPKIVSKKPKKKYLSRCFPLLSKGMSNVCELLTVFAP